MLEEILQPRQKIHTGISIVTFTRIRGFEAFFERVLQGFLTSKTGRVLSCEGNKIFGSLIKTLTGMIKGVQCRQLGHRLNTHCACISSCDRVERSCMSWKHVGNRTDAPLQAKGKHR